MPIRRDAIKVGGTYFCDHGDFRTVQAIDGQRVTFFEGAVAGAYPAKREMSLGRFAAHVVREELDMDD